MSGEQQPEIEVQTPPPAPDQQVEVQTEELPPDPGQDEDKPEQPGDGPQSDHPRFKSVYGRMKGAEAKVESLETEIAGLRDTMSGMRDHNQKLFESMERTTTQAVDAVTTLAQGQQRDEQADKIESMQTRLGELEVQKVKAKEDLDYSREVDIERDIRKLEFDIRVAQAEAVQPPPPAQPQGQGQGQQPQGPSPEFKGAADKFIAETEWFNPPEDGSAPDAMTAYATNLDISLSAHPEWAERPVAERFQEVKRLTEEKFGVKPQDPPPAAPATPDLNNPPPPAAPSAPAKPAAPAVEPGNLGSPQGPVRVTLTAEEQKVARGFGMSEQEYAKQKAAVER